MKKLSVVVLVSILITVTHNAFSQYSSVDAEKLGWRLSAQAWTFKNFTFIEALDMMKAAGIRNIEMLPTQKIGGGLEGATSFTMKKETREKLLAIIKAKGMKLINYGVAEANTRDEWDALFEFAKAMGIETIIAEPDSAQLNFIEPLCETYHINVALHNHPAPAVYHHAAMYWNPDSTMTLISKRNKFIGVCADFGHWLRSGLDPVTSLRRCQGRVLMVHAKDIVPGTDGFCGFHDVPWGTGLCNFSGLMHELRRQGYKGPISVEYEYHWDNSLPEVKESVEYFNRLSHWIGEEAQ
jgi:sugar phosphate isomerase/epimerase